MIDGVTIANNIKAERNRANVKIDDVCKALNISKPTYIEYEKNAELVKTKTLLKLSEIFNCDINMFFYVR